MTTCYYYQTQRIISSGRGGYLQSQCTSGCWWSRRGVDSSLPAAGEHRGPRDSKIHIATPSTRSNIARGDVVSSCA